MLARDLGKTRQELLDGVSATELQLWRVFYEVEADEARKAAE